MVLTLPGFGSAADPGLARVPVQAPAGVGLNKFDLLIQYLGRASGGNGSAMYRRTTIAMARKALDDARDNGVGYVRISASGFAPSSKGARGDLDLWQATPDVFWSQVDRMMDDLDSRSMRIVPVFLWNTGQFPAMAGETMAELIRNPQSASWLLMQSYVREFIERYSGRRTILFYELTNELNLLADLDNVKRCLKNRNDARCEVAGNFSTDDMIAFMERFARTVKAADPSRAVSSGFAIPRKSAQHLRARPEWGPSGPDWRADDWSQFSRYLTDVHAAMDVVSIHVYGSEENRRFGSTDPADVVVAAKKVTDAAGKILFVGEFGERTTPPGPDASFASRVLMHIGDASIPYSAMWVWQFYQRRLTGPPDVFNLEPGLSDFLIDRLKETNQRLGNPPQRRTTDNPPRVVLTWPLECAELKSSETLHAIASDDRGPVARVDFSRDGVPLGSDSEPPYQVQMGLDGLDPGEHRIIARAVDSTGKVASWSTRVFVGASQRSKSCARELERQ